MARGRGAAAWFHLVSFTPVTALHLFFIASAVQKYSGADRPGFDYGVMPLTVWVDGATPDHRRSTVLKPLVVACGNLIGNVTRSNKGKAFFAFVNKLTVHCPHPPLPPPPRLF